MQNFQDQAYDLFISSCTFDKWETAKTALLDPSCDSFIIDKETSCKAPRAGITAIELSEKTLKYMLSRSFLIVYGLRI